MISLTLSIYPPFYLVPSIFYPLPRFVRPPLTLAREALKKERKGEKHTTNSILFLVRLGSKEPVIVWGKRDDLKDR